MVINEHSCTNTGIRKTEESEDKDGICKDFPWRCTCTPATDWYIRGVVAFADANITDYNCCLPRNSIYFPPLGKSMILFA